jgi:hypothetical protein
MFKESPEGQTHSWNDGCGEPEHNQPTPQKIMDEIREKVKDCQDCRLSTGGVCHKHFVEATDVAYGQPTPPESSWEKGLIKAGDVKPEELVLPRNSVAFLLSLTRTKALEEAVGPEVCICAAVRMNDGYIVRGHRHADAIRTASKIPKYKDERPCLRNQGFVTSQGRYVDRLEGAKLQKAAGIKSKMPEGQEYLHGELYSEDLY